MSYISQHSSGLWQWNVTSTCPDWNLNISNSKVELNHLSQLNNQNCSAGWFDRGPGMPPFLNTNPIGVCEKPNRTFFWFSNLSYLSADIKLKLCLNNMHEHMKTPNLEINLKARQSAKAKPQLAVQIYWLSFSQWNPHQSISEDWSDDQNSINKPFAQTNILKVSKIC